MGKVRYIGSKLRIASQIIESIPFSPNRSFCDIFSGTGAISREAAIAGWKIKSNDYLFSAKILTTAQLLSFDDVAFSDIGGYKKALDSLNAIEGFEGPICKEYTPSQKSNSGHNRLYFTYENGIKIDGIRQEIEKWRNESRITTHEYTLLLADLLRATNSVANIAGTYGGYLKKLSSTSLRRITLEMHSLLNHQADFEVSQNDVSDFKASTEDIVYMDPPYTKRQYPAYYHILETVAHGDHPKVGGITGLRPWHHLASKFCYKTQALSALLDLVTNIGAKKIYISYSSEGHIEMNHLTRDLQKIGDVVVSELGDIGKYRPNVKASKNASTVTEYLIDFTLKQQNTQTPLDMKLVYG